LKKLKLILQSKYTYVLLVFLIFSYVFVSTKIIKYDNNLIISDEYIGTVTELSIKKDKVSFILKGEEKIRCNYYLNENEDFQYKNLLGKKIKVIGKIGNLYNNTIPNTFNYKKYLYNNKIYNTMTITNIEVIKEENLLYKVRNAITSKMNKYEDITKTYMKLLIFGENNLDSDIYENYRSNGIWHLFAVSGSHISFIVLILDKLLKRVKFKNFFISLILLYFMFLTNFAASILRATIFFYLKSLLEYLNIKISNIKLLFLTVTIILLYNPFMIYNLGFQYSFLITYAIMLEANNIKGNYFIQILKISTIAFIVSLPITVNLNYEINILSIVLNVIYVPFISFIVLPLCVLTLLFLFFSPVLDVLINILETSSTFFNLFKICIVIPKLSIFMIFIYYLLLYLYRQLKRKIFLLLLCIIIFHNYFPKFDNNLYVYYLDIGQGDSSIIRSPKSNEVIMIDTGGVFSSDYHVTKNTVLFLKSIGITKLDTLILTHGDFDHMGEAINLVNNFKVEKVIFNCGEFNELEQNLIKVLDKKKISYYSCIKELNIDDKKLYFLNNQDYGNENDNSSVIYTKLNNHKFLFMGDAGVEVEEDLIQKYNLQDIDILKVGHHGSKTSSSKEFIDQINPKYSIISVGKNNRYGHPNKEALSNLKNSKIYRTDIDGSIMFKIKNNRLKIETCSP